MRSLWKAGTRVRTKAVSSGKTVHNICNTSSCANSAHSGIYDSVTIGFQVQSKT